MPAEAISFEVFLPFVKNENVSVSFSLCLRNDSLEDSVRARKMPKSLQELEASPFTMSHVTYLKTSQMCALFSILVVIEELRINAANRTR